MTKTPSTQGLRSVASSRWHEVYDPAGAPRKGYAPLLDRLESLPRADLRLLDERMEAALREMGVHYHPTQGHGQQPSRCDLLPHIFSAAEWDRIVAGVQQRLTAFELFLQDIHGKRQILRDGVVPVHSVLGSAHYLNASVGLPLPRGAYLHLCSLSLKRAPDGAIMVQHHQLGRTAGLSYVMQNRRALARVLPEFFQEVSVRSIAAAPLALLETLAAAAPVTISDPSIVILSPGSGSLAYSDHSFLARRMGVPVVQGGDLLVLDAQVYLKTVRGLKRVDVIYNQVPDPWLDPLVLKKNSHLGVPGLIHSVRMGSVALMNAVGSRIVDDRALLSYAPRIIRYYLGEEPILPSLPSHWLGDIDQLEMVMDRIDDFRIHAADVDELSGHAGGSSAAFLDEVRKTPGRFIAHPRVRGVTAMRYVDGKPLEAEQDHLIFALRAGDKYEVIPGGLTRVFTETGWDTKDSWVLGDAGLSLSPSRPRRAAEASLPSRDVTSRVAEAFYWMGRYLERAYHQAYLIQVIETLETEELNSAERKLYRPMWNRLLPPLEKSAGASRRSITTRLDRYRLVLSPEPGSVFSAFNRAMSNAESVQESLSPEAWATLNGLALTFQKSKFRAKISEEDCGPIARRLSEIVTQRIPQFFAVASRTILGDDGWRFCEAGEMLERASITANAVVAIGKFLTPKQAYGIELSAFLRLLGTRDAYRRIYQARSEPISLLELLWQHPEAPRSVCRCLKTCYDLLRECGSPEAPGVAEALGGIDALIHRVRRIDWSDFIHRLSEEDGAEPASDAAESHRLEPLLYDLLGGILNVHNLISDGFLSHQAYIADAVQPLLAGFGHGI